MAQLHAGIAMSRIQERLAYIQTRFDSISAKTGISFEAHLQAAQEALPSEEDTGLADALLAGQTLDQALGTEGADTALSGEGSAESGLRGLDADSYDSINSVYKKLLENSEPVDSSQKLPSGKYDDLIARISGEYGVDARLVKAMCYAESGYRADATSPAGAMGLMQLMPATAKALGVTDGYDPEQNIDGGVRYIVAQLNRFDGDVRKAIAAYNCGPSRVTALDDLTDPAQRAQLPSETQNYLTKIEGLLSSVGASHLLDTSREYDEAAG